MIGLLIGGLAAAAGGIASAVAAKKQAQAQKSANDANLAEAEKTRQFNASEAEKARSFNSAEAQKQRDFEEKMSNTAVQRRMEDLKAAGINPLMAAGDAASTPSGAAASGVAASGAAAKVQAVSESAAVLGSIGDTLSSIGNTAVKVAMMKDLIGAKKFNNIMRVLR